MDARTETTETTETTFLDCLPTVGKCCFCISLKVGCLIIAVLGVLGSLDGFLEFGMEEADPCFEGDIYEFMKWQAFSFYIAMLITSVYCIIGIIRRWRNAVKVYMYVMTFSLILTLIFGICFFYVPTKKDCGESWAYSVANFFSCLGQYLPDCLLVSLKSV
ncbi:unnamed protein product [Chrysodeixis includens]|uniref:Uncharacterized protein n=1 Tax=Chrysodeixis includens TaxID=689277 RepID=A0A9P0BR88_CHRIL|nr:unnamed protein product [Chrysodeixis includens]